MLAVLVKDQDPSLDIFSSFHGPCGLSLAGLLTVDPVLFTFIEVVLSLLQFAFKA